MIDFILVWYVMSWDINLELNIPGTTVQTRRMVSLIVLRPLSQVADRRSCPMQVPVEIKISHQPQIPYYHVNSLEAIIQYTRVGGGTGCGEVSATNNRTPVISTTYQNGFFIPISTPFRLTAQAADLDGDTLTYTWEQFDPGIAESSLNPNGAPRGDAPIFRSVPPTLSPTRIFPALNKILANSLDDTEVLPTYDRKLTFRATVRDNNLGGGGVDWTEIAFRADENAGPFRIEEDVIPDTVFAGDYINISWDVAQYGSEPGKLPIRQHSLIPGWWANDHRYAGSRYG